MRRRFGIIAAALVGSMLFFGCTSPVALQPEPGPRLEVQEVRWKLGDDPKWSSPELDDGTWPRSRLHQIPEQSTLFWIRAEFDIENRHVATDEPLALKFAALATCEIYWDGLRLESGGQPGKDAASERPAPIDALIHLPAAQTRAGPHLLAGRCSTHHRQLELDAGFMEIAVGPYLALAEESLSYSWLAMASLSAKFLAAVYFFSIFYFGARARPALFLSLLNLSTGALLIAEVWRPLVGYTYDWHIPRLVLIHAMAWASNAWLLLFFLTRFPCRGRRVVGLATFVASLAIFIVVASFDSRVAWTFMLGLSVTFCWGIGAIRRAEPGGRLATAGVGLCLVAFASSPSRFLDQGVFFAFDGLTALLLIAQAMEAKALDAKSAGVPGENDTLAKEEDPEAPLPSPERALGKTQETGRPGKLSVKIGGRVELVDVDAILYVQGAGDYSALHLEDGRRHLHDESLKVLEGLLPRRFARVHRSYLVDLERVRRLRSHGGGRYRAELVGDVELPVSRTRIADIRRQLKST